MAQTIVVILACQQELEREATCSWKIFLWTTLLPFITCQTANVGWVQRKADKSWHGRVKVSFLFKTLLIPNAKLSCIRIPKVDMLAKKQPCLWWVWWVGTRGLGGPEELVKNNSHAPPQLGLSKTVSYYYVYSSSVVGDVKRNHCTMGKLLHEWKSNHKVVSHWLIYPV